MGCAVGSDGGWKCASGNPKFPVSKPGQNMRHSLLLYILQNSQPCDGIRIYIYISSICCLTSIFTGKVDSSGWIPEAGDPQDDRSQGMDIPDVKSGSLPRLDLMSGLDVKQSDKEGRFFLT
jgi:hypothetical protein